MPKAETSLNELLHEIRRIEENRTVLSEKKIKKIYKQLLKELNAFVGEAYTKYADESGALTVAQLQEKSKLAWYMNEIEKTCNKYLPDTSAEIKKTVQEAYEKCYTGMVEAVNKSYDLTALNVRPEVMKSAIDNNIEKLTLPDLLEKNRKEIIYDIKQVINIGLMNGDRYETMTRALTDKLDISYNKANNIVRTETHRNTEAGIMDGAIETSKGLENSGLVSVAIWRTMKDERVRPQQRRKKGKVWKTTLSRNGANHIKMEGVAIQVGDKFELETGVYAKCPSKSGVARHDCRCRCFLEYDILTDEEWAKYPNKQENFKKTNPLKKMKLDNNISVLNMQQTDDAELFASSLKKAKASNPHGGAVDEHPIEELKTFKTFLSANNKAGVAVKPDGDITAVFKNSNYKVHGAVDDLIITARENGGTKMDCYGIGLVNKYEKCGYVPVARVPFNADYVSDSWLLETKPDVYVLMKNTDDIETVIKKNAKKAYKLSSQADLDNLPTFTDYDAGLKYRDSLLAKQKKGIIIDAPEKHYTLSVTKEPAITETLQKAVSKTNGTLSGLDFRLKTESSYKRKVEKEVIDIQNKATKEGLKVTVTKEDVTQNMRDVVRYTCLSEKGDLVKDYNKIMGTLENDGYKVVRVKNTFEPDAPYKGINTIVQDPDGYNFELQFHTPQSFELKNGILHELYEEERLVTTTPARKKELQKQMKEISDSIVFPDDVDKIKAFDDLPDILDKLAKKSK